jgi:hypothetical protein
MGLWILGGMAALFCVAVWLYERLRLYERPRTRPESSEEERNSAEWIASALFGIAFTAAAIAVSKDSASEAMQFGAVALLGYFWAIQAFIAKQRQFSLRLLFIGTALVGLLIVVGKSVGLEPLLGIICWTAMILAGLLSFYIFLKHL